MLAEVTQIHIDAGVQQKSTSDPVSQAINEIVGDKYTVIFHYDCIYIYEGNQGKSERFLPSKELTDWIKRFDLDKRAVSPITVELKDNKAIIKVGR